MKKRIVAMLLLTALVTSSCGKTEQVLTPTEEPNQGSSEQATDSSKAENPATDTVSTSGDRSATLINASFLGDSEEVYYNKDLVPSVAPYSVSADFSNVVYDDEFDYLFDLSQQSEYNNVKARREALIKNNFYVEASSGESEFFDVYEGNRYVMFPSFITVDSLMHTYHLYFAHLMKTTEKDYLTGDLEVLTGNMFKAADAQAKALAGSEWENAARRNLAFFAVAEMLMQENSEIEISDSEILEIAYLFYFADEDAPEGKVWRYMNAMR